MTTASPAAPRGAAPSYPKCASCGLTLPLSPDGAGGAAPKQTVVCVGCNSTFHAVIAVDAPADLLSNIRIKIAAFDAPSPQPKAAPRTKPAPRGGVARERVVSRLPEPTEASRLLDAEVESEPSLAVAPTGPPFLAQLAPVGALPYDPEVEHLLTAELAATTEQVDALVDAIEDGRAIDVDRSEAIARDTLVQATRDLDLFLKLGVDPQREGYPGRHSLQVAMLAAGIGARLGWDRETLVQLGVGCLIHDLGMLKVPARDYLREDVLDDVGFCKIAAHPLHTFDLIEEHMGTVPLVTRMVAYQIHERCDGAGYPRKRHAPLIHEASKVAAIADVFIALVSPRPHREPLLPYQAMEHLIRAAAAGSFDREIVRALLRTVSLFPIGSCVELDDGRVGRVIRSNADDYCRPILETWRADELDAPPAVVDLAAAEDLAVRRPLPRLAA